MDFIAKIFLQEFHTAIDKWKAGFVTANDDTVVTNAPTANSSNISLEDEIKEVQFFLDWALTTTTNKYEAMAEEDDSVASIVTFCQNT